MYQNGQALTDDTHFNDHIGRDVPVQVYSGRYSGRIHYDIGYVQEVSASYVKVGDTFYRRDRFLFISRPGY